MSRSRKKGSSEHMKYIRFVVEEAKKRLTHEQVKYVKLVAAAAKKYMEMQDKDLDSLRDALHYAFGTDVPASAANDVIDLCQLAAEAAVAA